MKNYKQIEGADDVKEDKQKQAELSPTKSTSLISEFTSESSLKYRDPSRIALDTKNLIKGQSLAP